jgi:hypothetical protein
MILEWILISWILWRILNERAAASSRLSSPSSANQEEVKRLTSPRVRRRPMTYAGTWRRVS